MNNQLVLNGTGKADGWRQVWDGALTVSIYWGEVEIDCLTWGEVPTAPECFADMVDRFEDEFEMSMLTYWKNKLVA